VGKLAASASVAEIVSADEVNQLARLVFLSFFSKQSLKIGVYQYILGEFAWNESQKK